MSITPSACPIILIYPFGRKSTIALPTRLKRKIIDQCILPAMMYGAEMENKLSAAQQNTT
jgi:hypothetical protein